MPNQRGVILPLVLFGTVALLSGIGLVLYFFVYRPQVSYVQPLPNPKISVEISDFESCVKAGNPVQKSYPRRCSANGKSYTEIINVNITPEMKVYENTGDYFKILYPKDWSVDPFSLGAYFYSNELPKDLREKIEQTYPITLPMITVEVVHKEFSLTVNSEDILYTIKPQSITMGDKTGVYYQQLCSPSCGVVYDFPYADGKKTISFSVFNLDEETIASLSAEFNVSISAVNNETIQSIISNAEFE